MKTILLTGASGQVAAMIRPMLRDRYRLRLSDVRPVRDVGANESFESADISDPGSVGKAVDGVDGIIHLGAYSVEGPWPAIFEANFAGTYHVFEAARECGVERIVFASSNHAVGFYPRNQTIDHTVVPRPDGRYGLSKAFGESLGSLYADKYGARVLCIRIGNVGARPIDVRRLSIWISPRDLVQLVVIGLEHPDVRFEIVYGMSDNARAWWDNSNAQRLGYRPQDRSEDFAADILREHSADTGDPIADARQGGAFCTAEAVENPAESEPA